MLILVTGLPGSGKTALAGAYAEASGALHLNSDLLRRELGLTGQYRPEDKQRVYDTLLERARTALLSGRSVIVDSTFYRESIRRPFIELAQACGSRLRWVEVKADENTIRERVSRPRPDSEADFAVYERIRDLYEPLAGDHLVLWSDNETPEHQLSALRRYLSGDEI